MIAKKSTNFFKINFRLIYKSNIVFHSKWSKRKLIDTYTVTYKSLMNPLPVTYLNRFYKLTIYRSLVTEINGKIWSSQENNIDFDNLFDQSINKVIEDIYSEHSKVESLNEVKEWLHKAIIYNIKDGKRNRAKALVLAYKYLVPEANDEMIRNACLLGWCVEFLQSFFLIYDDIMDHSITRRGQPCWYRKENIGLIAINDGLMINNVIYRLLKQNFGSSPIYVYVVDLINDVTRYTAYGQCLDLLSNPKNQPLDLNKFTDTRYDTIVKYKTAYYSFCLPVRLAMYLANIKDPEVHSKSQTILLQLGHFFQVQDDYLDCFGDPNVTGKIGTDIEDGKCSWLIVEALKLANQEQRSAINQNYGIKSKDSVGKIKKIYRELKLEQVFHEYEQRKYNEISNMIKLINEESLSKDFFNFLLSLIHKRKK